jgi:hypothetical protein
MVRHFLDVIRYQGVAGAADHNRDCISNLVFRVSFPLAPRALVLLFKFNINYLKKVLYDLKFYSKYLEPYEQHSVAPVDLSSVSSTLTKSHSKQEKAI